MQKIKRLSESVSSKIAAGEVCERPLNAIKELIENSVDAKSDNIKIEILDGGLSLIRITDNGIGIDKEDLPLAIERFATSKATSLDDVYSATTFGFRGEALSAISAVSDFTLKSGTDNDNIFELQSYFGDIKDVTPAPGLKGTTITIKNLFENFPARRKFLKSAKSLEIEIVRFIKQFSLVNHNIAIRLILNNKDVFVVDKSDDTLKKVAKIFIDKEFNSSIYEHNSTKILATVTTPNCSDRFRRDAIIIAVNGRLIQDRSLVQAVCQAYSRRIPDGRFPIAVMDIRIDPTALDANVHPAKLEVRFEKPKDIYMLIIEAINRCFGDMNIFADYTTSDHMDKKHDPIIADKKADIDYNNSFNHQADFVKEDDRIAKYDYNNYATISDKITSNLSSFQNNIEYIEDDNISSDLFYEIVGQVAKTFIIIEKGDDIIFIDQHVAHERILYEEKLERDRQIRSSIVLHDPIRLKIDTDIIDEIFADIEIIELLGYMIDKTDSEIIIKNIPTSIVRKNIEVEFRKTVAELFQKGVTKSYDRRILSLSCKKAIKAGDRLTTEEMRFLIDELNKCKNNSTCPHGRPITFKMSMRQLASRFNR